MVLNKNIKVPSTFEIVKTVVNKGEWKLKSPLQKWSFLYGIGRSCLKLWKHPIYEEDQTLHWFSYFPLFYLFVYIALGVYTAIYYISHSEFIKCFPCTCLLIGPVCGVHLNSVCSKEIELIVYVCIFFFSATATFIQFTHKGTFHSSKIYDISWTKDLSW